MDGLFSTFSPIFYAFFACLFYKYSLYVANNVPYFTSSGQCFLQPLTVNALGPVGNAAIAPALERSDRTFPAVSISSFVSSALSVVCYLFWCYSGC